MIQSLNEVGAVVWVLLPADRQRDVDIMTLKGGIWISLETTEVKV
jgi:hypothetical protein